MLLTAFLSLLMASHWAPMVVPSLAVVVLAVVRPEAASRAWVWWVMAAVWLVALVAFPDHMEDHVLLFAVWLVALAICLGGDPAAFSRAAAWQARVLIGVVFCAAVLWKLWFGEFLSGGMLRTYMIVDSRFGALAWLTGVDSERLTDDRAAAKDILNGADVTLSLSASDLSTAAIALAAVATLVIEILIVAAHLAPDSSRLARLRLPSIVAFGLVTYSVVPVLPFAALLGLLTVVIAGWRREVMWVFPALVAVAAVRLVTLGL